MYSDPQTITVDQATVSLPRTGLSLTEGSFASADGEFALTVGHSSGRRVRHVIKVSQTKLVSDPLIPSTNQVVGLSAHLVVDLPRNGVSHEEAVNLAAALAAWATESNLNKLVGNES